MKYVNSIYTPDMSGRLGGAVFSKNKYGVYMKMFKSPSNPRTTYQQNVRAFFASASREWAAMTSAQITSWNDIAPSISFVKNGLTYTLTGFNLFVKLNRNLQDIGSSFYKNIERTGLITPADMNGSSVAIVETPGSEDIKLTIPATLASGVKAIVYATPILKSSRKPNWNSLRVITTIDHTFTSGDSIMDEYLAKFANMPATGETVGFVVMPVNGTSGMTNSKVYFTATGAI